MAYPVVSTAYGFKPVGLLGGQDFASSTREYNIAYNYGTAIFTGDFVKLVAGFIQPAGNDIASNVAVGVFVGCSFTNPVTKQKTFSQYYPASTAAGDIVAFVSDDPDNIYRAAVVSAAGVSTVASGSVLLVGQNMAGSTLAGSITTGNSQGGVVVSTTAASAGNYRVLAQVPDTQVKTGATYVSGTGTTTLTLSGLPLGAVIPMGTDIYQSVAGQLQHTGSVVTTAAVTVASISSQALTVTASTATILAANPIVLVQTPEVLVKVTFGAHRYYVA